MNITVNGTDYKIRFGIGFVRAMDEKYFVKTQTGIKFGMGLETKIPILLGGDPVTLAEFLYEGTCTEEKRPSQEEIDDYLDTVEDMNALFDEVVEELKKQNATKMKTLQFEKDLKETEEKIRKAETVQKK